MNYGENKTAEGIYFKRVATINHIFGSYLDTHLTPWKRAIPGAFDLSFSHLQNCEIHLFNCWFDNYSLGHPGQRSDLQVDGLYETAEFIRALITQMFRILGEGGYQKVILLGIS
ncbi:hypothetical protein N7462_010602 [Penicillium macrosclerotiorum]|uniref:uncharacterized protein n=1 Tax=Penicillium macrosclerotiorum TaxID=303699 RepID=UPI0025483955|nr:uncharacterized protein N7462_010602 [Penicillium macrosclerotiorum]KAJ5669532.1 hypothetical protein N7462_010602 [Penicillium macrosclerotiorum]